jgi:hypothetical protein
MLILRTRKKKRLEAEQLRLLRPTAGYVLRGHMSNCVYLTQQKTFQVGYFTTLPVSRDVDDRMIYECRPVDGMRISERNRSTQCKSVPAPIRAH